MNPRRFTLKNFRRAARRPGFALVVALAAIVLITIIVLAFFSRALLNRQVSFSSTNQIKSDMLARTAADIIVGELRQEVADYSAPPVNGLYQPLAASNMVPAKLGVTGADSTFGAYTIAKISSANTKIDPGTNGISLGSSVALNISSRNGRVQSQWFNTGPKLGTASLPSWVYLSRNGAVVDSLSGGGTTNVSSPNYVTGRFAYTVYNTGGLLDANIAGYRTNMASTNFGGKSSMAYADLTALGLTPDQVDRFVLWRNAATAANAVTFDAWATGINTNNSATDKTAADAAAWGYLYPVLGDNVFFSRRDMLRYFNAKANTNALSGLTHFSRSLKAPTWGPSNVAGSSILYGNNANNTASVNRFLPGVTAFDGVVTEYADNGTSTTREIYSHDPLVGQRFSLAKLAWLGYDGPNAAAFDSSLTPGDREEAIKTCFGLSWNGSLKRWVYNHGNANFILTLDEVRQQKRAPDFFELLKAGILRGSLGGSPGPVTTSTQLETPAPGTSGDVEDYSDDRDRHILQIGANIIDQADRDNYPTTIYIANIPVYPEDDLYNCVFGTENLPVLNRMGIISVFWPDHVGSPVGPGDMRVFLQPEVWNPNDSATANPAIYPTPSKLRFVTYGACSLWYRETTSIDSRFKQVLPAEGEGTPAVMYFGNDPRNPQNNGIVYFKNPAPSSVSPPAFFNRPVLLTGFYSGATDYFDHDYDAEADPNNRYKKDATVAQWDGTLHHNPFLAVYLGSVPRNMQPEYPPMSDLLNPPLVTPPAVSKTTQQNKVRVIPDAASGGYLTFALEFKDPNGVWRPYSVIARQRALYLQGFSNGTRYGRPSPSAMIGRADPRTDRFSTSGSQHLAGQNQTWQFGASMRQGPSSIVEEGDSPGRAAIVSAWPQSAVFIHNKLSGKYYTFDAWAQNLVSSDSRYSDPDGVTRPGDSWRANFATASNGVTDTSGDGMMTYHLLLDNNKPQLENSMLRRRPIILNRPFRSVAELGFVFRDQPWKTLDLWSQNSADAGLVELFEVSQKQSDMIAGQFNPNAAPPKVLEAMLKGALKHVNTTNNLVSAEEALAAANTISSQLSNNVAANPSDVIGRLADPLYNALAGTLGNNSPTNQPFRNKMFGETPLRALGSYLSTRTWNFLVDVSAQSGKLSANASGLQDFIVEGEKRYWLHIAIDRFTGKVVDSQFEPVYE